MIQPLDSDTASSLVKQLYPSAKEPMLGIELEITKGSISYRPYAVYAKFLILEYRRLSKADTVAFQYNPEAAKNALNMQKSLDSIYGDVIPESQTVDALMGQLRDIECDFCENPTDSDNLGIMII